jgi:translation initiation factor IF-1
MVKNIKGGNKSKGQARKFVTAKPSTSLRIAENELEKYGQVIKILGGGMCTVICNDNTTRLCIIRGKFKTRGKRDNFIINGTWVLIGLRDWSSSSAKSDKLEQCDLLEVYNDFEKDKLKSTLVHVNWSLFITNDNKTYTTITKVDNDSDIVFSDEKEEEYYTLMSRQLEESYKSKAMGILDETEEEIYVDDI